MTKDEALKLAFEAFQYVVTPSGGTRAYVWDSNEARLVADAYRALEKALAQHDSVQAKPEPEQEPVAWLITDEKINSLQVDSIQRLIDRARHAHMTDIKLRINGQDEWHQADWLKHLTRTTPPQRTWVGLTDEQRMEMWRTTKFRGNGGQVDWFIEGTRAAETALREALAEQPAQQEPVAFEEWLAKQHGDPEEIGFLQALRIAYIAGQDSITSPTAQRTWVGLTDEEIDYIYTGIRAVHHDVDSDVLCRAIEAKLKERNT